MKWKKARKKPIEVEFREVIGNLEIIATLEGELYARKGKHYIMRGVKGELYPIDKGIFEKTYDVIS